MTDKEAVLSIINSNFQICASLYPEKDSLRCINGCTSCSYKDITDDFPCWQHKIAEMLLELIPQLDLFKGLASLLSYEKLK